MKPRPLFLACTIILESKWLISTTSVPMTSFRPTFMTSTWNILRTVIIPHRILMMIMEMQDPKMEEDNSTELLTFLSKQKGSTHPGHLANVLSTSKAKNAKGARFTNKPSADPLPPKNEEIVANGWQIISTSPFPLHPLFCLLPQVSQTWLACQQRH